MITASLQSYMTHITIQEHKQDYLMLQTRTRLFIPWDCKIISIWIISRFSRHYQHYQFYSMQKLPAVSVKTAIKKKLCQLTEEPHKIKVILRSF